MKKAVSLIVIFALMLGLACFAEAAPEEDYYVYIGLKYMTNAVESIDLSCPDGFYLADAGRNGFEITENLSSYTNLRVSNENGMAVLTDPFGEVLMDSLAADQALISANPDPDSRIIKIGGTSYRDGVVFGAYSMSSSYPGTLCVANYITLEHYLWGVVNNELGYTNPSEALKAQAVAARSFTLANLGKHGGGALSFDLCFRTHCQAYGGVSSEKAQTTAACEATRGIVIAYGSDVACAYYHAYNGGYTMDAADVWSTDLGYLRSVPDEYTSVHNWATSFSFDELTGILESSGRTVGQIRSVRIGQRLANGAVSQMIFEGSSGTVYLNKNNIMDLLNLKSRWFSMGAEDYLPARLITEETPVVTGKNPVSVSAEKFAELYVFSPDSAVRLENTVAVVSASERTEKDIAGLVVYDGFEYRQIEADLSRPGGPVIANDDDVSDAPFSDEICSDGMIYLSGVGFGHGVGLCQTGMTNRANAGQTYEEIIHAYLTDVELVEHSILGY